MGSWGCGGRGGSIYVWGGGGCDVGGVCRSRDNLSVQGSRKVGDVRFHHCWLSWVSAVGVSLPSRDYLSLLGRLYSLHKD